MGTKLSIVEKIAYAIAEKPFDDEWEIATSIVPSTVNTEQVERFIRKAHEFNRQREQNGWA